ncbi:MAG TPA: alginate export family protein [Candidatus Omnitrophota bacterium]|nr:alginate export family protein [Candidatus Omnitrophota bacterium]HRZ15643.1 alginate export family protein [Candidatus Omnitrophota bacterium]
MSKRLILVLALALVVGLTAGAYAEVQNVKVGGDITMVGVTRSNLDLNKEIMGDDVQQVVNAKGLASITRVKIDADLTDNVSTTVRLINERVWGSADETVSNSDVDLDLAFVAFKDFLKDTITVPLTLIAGRQEIRIGSGLLVSHPGGNQGNVGATAVALPRGIGDLSSRRAFDGIAGVWKWSDQLTTTTAYVKAVEGVITDEHDTDVYVVDSTFDTGKMGMVPELYYVGSDAKKGQVNNFGARINVAPVENLNLSAEFCYQTQKGVNRLTGKTNHATDNAILLGANFAMPDVVWAPSFGLDYARLSENWNIMHEGLTPADIANFLFANTNCTVVGITVSAKPKDDLSLKLRYADFTLVEPLTAAGTIAYNGAALTTGQSYTMTTKKHLGAELDLALAYDYTEDVQFGLNYGYFRPGKAFDKSNRNSASQVIGSMKVSF